MPSGWSEIAARVIAMSFIFGIVCIAGFVFNYDGKVLLTAALLIVGLGNIEILKLILPYITKVVSKAKGSKGGDNGEN